MEDAEPPFELSVSTDAWTLTRRVGGFELVVHPFRGVARKLRVTVIGAALSAAVLWVVIDIGLGRGFALGPIIAGAIGGVAGGLLARLSRIWMRAERLVLDKRLLTHEGPRKRRRDRQLVTLGPTVELEREPKHLADGLHVATKAVRASIVLHTNGRSVGFGAGLDASDADVLMAAIEHRIAPERIPEPGRPGTVHALHSATHTGGEPQRRFVGRQRTPPIDTEGSLTTTVLVTSAAALLIGGAVVFAEIVTGGTPGELWVTTAVLGLVGVLCLAQRVGLLDRWRQRELARASDPVSGRPNEPWTWHGRWPGGVVRRTTLYRLAHTSATYGLPVIGGMIAWFGAPPNPLAIPVWIGLVALALAPMALYVWHLAFAGTTEVRVPEVPLVPGGRVDLRFALHRDAAPFSSIAFRLVRTQRRPWNGPVPFFRYWTTHEGVYHLPDDTPPPGPNEEVPVVFDIPADAGGTDEVATPAIRWFLEVRGVTSAGPYIEAFPVPVFDRVDVADDAT